MKKVTEFYGGIGIAGIGILFVLLIFTSSWILDGLQQFFPLGEENYSTYEDSNATHEILTTPKPEIVVTNNPIHQKEICNLKELISVKDWQGREIPFEILSIVDKAGNNIFQGQHIEQFLFEKAGKYFVSIGATDTKGIYIEKKVPIPVQAKQR